DGIGIISAQIGVEIVGARDFASRKRFFKRAVVAETRGNVSPFREERFVRRAASHVSADRHRAKSAALITLPAREDTVWILQPNFEVKLPREFYRGFGGFRSSRSKVDAAAVTEIRR